MDTEDNSVNMGNMGIHGGARRGIMKGRARKPRSMSPLRTKSKSRKHGGAEEEEMEGGARRARRAVRKPKSGKHGGAEEEDMEEMEEMDGGARRGKKKLNKYQSFVKRRMCDMTKLEPGLPQVEKMRKIAAEWKANK